MKRSEYMKRALEARDSGRVSEEAYDAILLNADIFCDDDDDQEHDNLPDTYAEIDYDDFDDPEAVDGARFDDWNYLRYTER